MSVVRRAVLGNLGLILLLFETPSGFAIFRFDGIHLFLPNAKENIWANFVKDYMAHDVIWLKEFKTFKNKARVFGHAGVDKELAEMIHRWHVPGQLLAVGKLEHKIVIESELNIPCMYDDTVMEVIWGIKNLMKSLVPDDDSKLSKEECLQMSLGMETVLMRHGIVVTPEMINEQIIEYASILYDCELYETKHSGFLTNCGDWLEEIFGIECKGWSPMKLATALKILCIPEDYIPHDDPELLLKLKTHGPDYDGILLKRTSVTIHREMVTAREVLTDTVEKLKLLTTEANGYPENPEGFVKQETSYLTLHHREKDNNFCLFMPRFDALRGTINAKSWKLQKEVDQGMNDRVPDFVFLAHVVDMVSSTQVPFAFRSCSSLPFATRLMLLPLWPVAFAFMLLQWFCSKTFTVSFYFLRGRLHHTWSVPYTASRSGPRGRGGGSTGNRRPRAGREASGRGSSGSTLDWRMAELLFRMEQRRLRESAMN
ncbi:hypothetical protein C2845_PM08G13050 [Panicum miliaceum]|uniref:Uncharacterized protein n=1 Tax=Panicum miliaceum TaxID=4540 RepID=A0A3L6R4S1_PANMI|nr:hypothetical protein C2845_PM08G13050 [Panicum miliaceum]